jgi:hypothetical protein
MIGFVKWIEDDGFTKNFSSSFEQIPEQIEKLKSNRTKIRISAIRSLWHIVTTKWFGLHLHQYLNEIVSKLFMIIINYHTIEEHDESLRLICCLSIHVLDKFDEYGSFLLNQLSRLFSCSTHEESFRFYVVSVLASFSIVDEDQVIRTLDLFIAYFVKEGSKVEFFSRVISKTILQGIILMISSLESRIVVENFLSRIENVLMIAGKSIEYSILVECLRLIGAIHSCLLDLEYEELSDEIRLIKHTWRSFALDNISRIQKIWNSHREKSGPNKLKSICSKYVRYLEEGNWQQTIYHNKQFIYFEGYKKCVLLDTIREISLSNFYSVLLKNHFIQKFFNFSLDSSLRMGWVVTFKSPSLKDQKHKIKKYKKAKITDLEKENNFLMKLGMNEVALLEEFL